MTSFLELPVREFLDQVAARTPAPGGGGAAAVTGAMAAGLVAMAARFSGRQLPSAGDLADQADKLRVRVADLAEEDARAYAAVLGALRLPQDAGQQREAQRREAQREAQRREAQREAQRREAQREVQRREALLGAAMVPLEIAEIGARVAAMAVQVAEAGNQNLRGDAVTGAVLAAASARSAASLVDINIRLGGLDPELSQRAAQAAADAGDAAKRIMS